MEGLLEHGETGDVKLPTFLRIYTILMEKFGTISVIFEKKALGHSHGTLPGGFPGYIY